MANELVARGGIKTPSIIINNTNVLAYENDSLGTIINNNSAVIAFDANKLYRHFNMVSAYNFGFALNQNTSHLIGSNNVIDITVPSGSNLIFDSNFCLLDNFDNNFAVLDTHTYNATADGRYLIDFTYFNSDCNTAYYKTHRLTCPACQTSSSSSSSSTPSSSSSATPSSSSSAAPSSSSAIPSSSSATPSSSSATPSSSSAGVVSSSSSATPSSSSATPSSSSAGVVSSSSSAGVVSSSSSA